MAIRIESDRVSSLVGKLVAEVGETDEGQKQAEVARSLMQIGERCVSHAPADWIGRDFDFELYDELGLPRSS